MTSWVALLRGVNVGSAKRMKMEALRAVFASLGLDGVQTYLQSGNVVFRSDETKAAALSTRIEAGIEAAFGFHSDVILRTSAEMNRVAAQNPFEHAGEMDPAKLLVLFAAAPLEAIPQDGLVNLAKGPEQVRATATEIYVFYPEGMGRSKLSGNVFEKALKTSLTGRNWNTIASLARLLNPL